MSSEVLSTLLKNEVRVPSLPAVGETLEQSVPNKLRVRLRGVRARSTVPNARPLVYHAKCITM